MSDDVIDRLAGIGPGSGLDGVRRQRDEARRHAQASFDGLFTPVDASGFSVTERWAVAAFLALLHNQGDAAAFYAEGLAVRDTVLARAVGAEAGRAAARGPFGRLVDAGWTTPAIVTLSQLVAFLSFQIRVVAGFRAMQQAA